MCVFHIWIWPFASSLCVTVAFVQAAKVVRPPDNKTPINKEILNNGDSGSQARPRPGDSRLNRTVGYGRWWHEMAFEKRKFVVESGCCAATKGKTVYDRVLEQAESGLDHGEIVGVAA